MSDKDWRSLSDDELVEWAGMAPPGSGWDRHSQAELTRRLTDELRLHRRSSDRAARQLGRYTVALIVLTVALLVIALATLAVA
jgi:hypothetical protein